MTLLYAIVYVALLGSDADEVLMQEKQFRRARIDQYCARMEKQVLVHLTPSGAKVFTPNRPPDDKDLLDRVLPFNELAIVCDSLEQVVVDGKPTWKFIGNVRLHATKALIFCHEASVSQESEFLIMDISGGREGDPLAPPPRLDELSSPEGTALIGTERGREKPHEFASAICVPAARIKQRLDTGAYAVIIKCEPPLVPKR